MRQWGLLIGNVINVEEVRIRNMLRIEFLQGMPLLPGQKEAGIQDNQIRTMAILIEPFATDQGAATTLFYTRVI